MLARGGREREIVNKDDHYSPHFQVGARRSPPGPLTFSLRQAQRHAVCGGVPSPALAPTPEGHTVASLSPGGAPLREGLWLWILACG